MDKLVKKGLLDLKIMVKELEKAYEEVEVAEGHDIILSPFDIRMLYGAQGNIAVLYENLKFYKYLSTVSKEQGKAPESPMKYRAKVEEQLNEDGHKEKQIEGYS